MATLQETLNNITNSIQSGFEVFVTNKVQAEIAPASAQQVPTPAPLPVKANVESFVRDNTTLLLVGAGLLALVLLKK